MMAYLRIALSACSSQSCWQPSRWRTAISCRCSCFPTRSGHLIGFNVGFGLPLFILLGLADRAGADAGFHLGMAA